MTSSDLRTPTASERWERVLRLACQTEHRDDEEHADLLAMAHWLDGDRCGPLVELVQQTRRGR